MVKLIYSRPDDMERDGNRDVTIGDFASIEAAVIHINSIGYDTDVDGTIVDNTIQFPNGSHFHFLTEN